VGAGSTRQYISSRTKLGRGRKARGGRGGLVSEEKRQIQAKIYKKKMKKKRKGKKGKRGRKNG